MKTPGAGIAGNSVLFLKSCLFTDVYYE
uniref:Uncharacterized protein n=1 Tax=Anguilla anguilla TaxID=7936 RepID=A0A0E9R7U2_ANGAN